MQSVWWIFGEFQRFLTHFGTIFNSPFKIFAKGQVTFEWWRVYPKLRPCVEFVTLLKKPTWDPHGTQVGTMSVPCGTLVDPCGNYVGPMWDPCGSLWEPCGNHVRPMWEIASGSHVETMWDPCEKLLRDPIGNHVGPMWETDGNHVGPMWVPYDQSKKN